MARYRVHRMKDTPRENFRWSAHTSGLAIVKAKDYEAGEELESDTPYGAWKALQSEGRPLFPGDLLESCRDDASPGPLLIVKYIGFEPAEWYVPAPKIESDPSRASGVSVETKLAAESH